MRSALRSLMSVCSAAAALCTVSASPPKNLVAMQKKRTDRSRIAQLLKVHQFLVGAEGEDPYWATTIDLEDANCIKDEQTKG